MALARIAETNPCLRAVITTNPFASAAARTIDRQGRAATLSGRTMLVKDNIDTLENATTAGSLALARNDTSRDAPIVASLRRAGVIVVGKANMSEWAGFRGDHQIAGWSAMGGQTRNPYDPTRTPGGSSSGSAVAVAAGMVDLAIGTDTGGSIIGPAAYNGVVGFRPSVGRTSRRFVVPLTTSFDTVGPLTRTVRDAALVMDAISANDTGDPASAGAPPPPRFSAGLNRNALRGVRLGVLRFDAALAPETHAVFERALKILRASGAILVDIGDKGAVPDTDADEWTVMTAEFKAGVNAYLRTAARAVETRSLAALIAFDTAHAAEEMPLFGQQVFIQAQAAVALDDPIYLRARERVQRAAGPDFVDRLLRDHDVVALVAPTSGPAPHIHPAAGERRPVQLLTGERAAVAGYPHLTVPIGLVDAMPVGLSFIGTKWSDQRLLDYGYAYERARDSRRLSVARRRAERNVVRQCLALPPAS